MAAGSALWAGISSVTNVIYEGSLFTLRSMNSIAPTFTVFQGTMGVSPRKVNTYSAVSVSALNEGTELISESFAKSALSTLTPSRHGAMVNLTDERLTTDPEGAPTAIAFELGAAISDYIDSTLAANFASFTGGTIGSAGGTLTWSNIIAGIAKLRQQKIYGPLYCTLGEGQWYHLVNAAVNTTNAFTDAPNTRDRLIQNYKINTALGGVTFVISNNIKNNGGTSGTAAIYSPIAAAYDERNGGIQFETNRYGESATTKYIANFWFAHGVWRPVGGVTLIGTDVVPS